MKSVVVTILLLAAIVAADRDRHGGVSPVKLPEKDGDGDLKNRTATNGSLVNCSTGKQDGRPDGKPDGQPPGNHRPHAGPSSPGKSKQQRAQEVLLQSMRENHQEKPVQKTNLSSREQRTEADDRDNKQRSTPQTNLSSRESRTEADDRDNKQRSTPQASGSTPPPHSGEPPSDGHGHPPKH